MRKKIFAFVFAAALLVAMAVPALGTASGAEAHPRCVTHEDFDEKPGKAADHVTERVQMIANGQNLHTDPPGAAGFGVETAKNASPAITGC